MWEEIIISQHAEKRDIFHVAQIQHIHKFTMACPLTNEGKNDNDCAKSTQQSKNMKKMIGGCEKRNPTKLKSLSEK